jgi:polyisoprenoid-binding protein YceI
MSTIESTTALPTGTWNADPVHSQLGFEIAYMGGTFRGTFSPFEATLEVREDGSAHLEGATQVAGVKVQDPNLEAHLQSPDFFDAERFPEIRFASDDVVRQGEAVTVRGDLTIRGETEEVELRGTLAEGIVDGYGNERVRLSLAGTIDRSRFGVNWNMALPSGDPALPNEVALTGELSFVKAQS